MGIWDEVSQKVSRAADAAAQGIDRGANYAKMRYRLSTLHTDLQAKYAEIGKLHLEELRAGAERGEEIGSLIGEIDAIEQEIASLEEQCAAVRGGRRCDCGAIVKNDAVYCTKCGKKL